MNIKRTKLALAALFMFGGGILSTANASALTCPLGTERAGDTVDNISEGNEKSNTVFGDNDYVGTVQGGHNNDLMGTVTTIINVVLGIVGLIAVVMIIIGGINFVTSQGDTAKVTKAKNTVLYGVIGLVVALLAFAIVNFVLANVFAPKTETE